MFEIKSYYRFKYPAIVMSRHQFLICPGRIKSRYTPLIEHVFGPGKLIRNINNSINDCLSFRRNSATIKIKSLHASSRCPEAPVVGRTAVVKGPAVDHSRRIDLSIYLIIRVVETALGSTARYSFYYCVIYSQLRLPPNNRVRPAKLT